MSKLKISGIAARLTLALAGVGALSAAHADRLIIRFVGQITEASCQPLPSNNARAATLQCRSPIDQSPELWTTPLRAGETQLTTRAKHSVREVFQGGKAVGAVMTVEYF
ncbi:hypothetical protein BTL55_08995 [Bordetella trematum]|uniref:hypothetical protein n=1 Tax=Bordetella trematum TaxID=123899 RepID=UPI000C762FE5|nr:hypothetical protein [Bordetella trematum]AUL47095.1 hypothetical protein BTL55_08995 [Bordetella trematum]